jgi:hypothetical protein
LTKDYEGWETEGGEKRKKGREGTKEGGRRKQEGRGRREKDERGWMRDEG